MDISACPYLWWTSRGFARLQHWHLNEAAKVLLQRCWKIPDRAEKNPSGNYYKYAVNCRGKTSRATEWKKWKAAHNTISQKYQEITFSSTLKKEEGEKDDNNQQQTKSNILRTINIIFICVDFVNINNQYFCCFIILKQWLK